MMGVGIFCPNFSNVMGKCKQKISIAILYTHPINSRKKKREIATEKPDKNQKTALRTQCKSKPCISG
jgi:hypothetical protein